MSNSNKFEPVWARASPEPVWTCLDRGIKQEFSRLAFSLTRTTLEVGPIKTSATKAKNVDNDDNDANNVNDANDDDDAKDDDNAKDDNDANDNDDANDDDDAKDDNNNNVIIVVVGVVIVGVSVIGVVFIIGSIIYQCF